MLLYFELLTVWWILVEPKFKFDSSFFQDIILPFQPKLNTDKWAKRMSNCLRLEFPFEGNV